jgi:hypothetical protein
MLRLTPLLLVFFLMLVGCMSAPPSGPVVTLSDKDTLDILEAALRYRLSKSPLPPHVPCHVFVERTDAAVVQLSRRFPEYRMTVLRGFPQSPPPPWRDLWVGRTEHDRAWITVTGSAARDGPGWIVELRREAHGWRVVGEQPAIII